MSSVESNKQVVERFVREVLEQGSKPAVDELVATDFASHSWPGKGPTDLKAAMDLVN